jgi:hypothetical protein
MSGVEIAPGASPPNAFFPNKFEPVLPERCAIVALVVRQTNACAAPWRENDLRGAGLPLLEDVLGGAGPQTVGECGGDHQPDVSRTNDDNIGLADTTIGRHRHRDVQRSSRASTYIPGCGVPR